jgi:hypothetical protein
MTLVEVLLASAILAIGLTVLLNGIANCLSVFRASREFSTAQWVLGLGELSYPIRTVEDVQDLAVDDDRSLAEGFTFARTVQEEDEQTKKDGLYEVRTRVTWGEAGPGECEEVVRLVWHPSQVGG